MAISGLVKLLLWCLIRSGQRLPESSVDRCLLADEAALLGVEMAERSLLSLVR